MKNPDRLALYGWPVLAVIILFSLFAGLMLLPDIKQVPARTIPKAAAVRFAATDNREPFSPEETAEIRALYASDLFASTRINRLSVLWTAPSRLTQTNMLLAAPPLFLLLSPSSSGTGPLLSAIERSNADSEAIDLPFFFHQSGQPGREKPKNPGFSVELKGGLSHIIIKPDFLGGIAMPADRKPRIFQAQMRLNDQGCVAHLFAESTDFEPALYHEIVRRLYQQNFSNVTRACEGSIMINYPFFSAVNCNNEVNARIK